MRHPHTLLLARAASITLLILGVSSPSPAQASIPIPIPQPGFGWIMRQVSMHQNGGTYGEGEELATVETEQFVISVCRTRPYQFSPSQGGNFLLYRKIFKNQMQAVVKVFAIGPTMFRGEAECSLTLSHDGAHVLIATNQMVGFGTVPEMMLVMKIDISSDAIVWGRRYQFGSFDVDEVSGLEIVPAYTSTGAASGYAVVGSGRAEFPLGQGFTLFAFKLDESGTPLWQNVMSLPGATQITDAESHNRNVRMVGHNEFGNIVVQRVNTDTGDFGNVSWFSIPDQFLHDPAISLNVESDVLHGYFLSFSRSSGALEPIVMRAKNNGTPVWSRRLSECGLAIGVVSSGSEVYALAETGSPTGQVSTYKRLALDKNTGDLVPGMSVSTVIPSPLAAMKAYSFDRGYQSRLLITANDFEFNALDRWAVYKENAGLLIGVPNYYDCPDSHEYGSIPIVVDHEMVGKGLHDPQLSSEVHWPPIFSPFVVVEECSAY
ncbi:MAG: hypothetical protein KDC38_00190 [Planctomycetes bacterium]|nr:hypothetical protein [Planctomycetota bacterium]